MTVDYSAGQGLTEATTACTTALKTLQQLGASDAADDALTTAESVSYDSILNDGSRSQEWKIQASARQYINVVTELSNDLTAVATTASRQYKADAATVFGTQGLQGDPATLTISRRDAAQRVEEENDSIRLQRLLAQASEIGDDVLSHAIAEKCVSIGDSDTVTLFQELYPQLSDAVARLWACATRKVSGADITTAWRVAAVRPAVLASLQDYEVVSAALGNANAGAWSAG
jgi:hypothetical protein